LSMTKEYEFPHVVHTQGQSKWHPAVDLKQLKQLLTVKEAIDCWLTPCARHRLEHHLLWVPQSE